MTLIVLWLGFSILAAVVAANKGRSAVGFFFLALFLSPLIGLIAALVARENVRAVEDRAIGDGERVRCEACAELIRPEAVICKHCGRPRTATTVKREHIPTEEEWDRFIAAANKPKPPAST